MCKRVNFVVVGFGARAMGTTISNACKKLQRAYSLVFVTEDKFGAVKDPFGF